MRIFIFGLKKKEKSYNTSNLHKYNKNNKIHIYIILFILLNLFKGFSCIALHLFALYIIILNWLASRKKLTLQVRDAFSGKYVFILKSKLELFQQTRFNFSCITSNGTHTLCNVSIKRKLMHFAMQLDWISSFIRLMVAIWFDCIACLR